MEKPIFKLGVTKHIVSRQNSTVTSDTPGLHPLYKYLVHPVRYIIKSGRSCTFLPKTSENKFAKNYPHGMSF